MQRVLQLYLALHGALRTRLPLPPRQLPNLSSGSLNQFVMASGGTRVFCGGLDDRIQQQDLEAEVTAVIALWEMHGADFGRASHGTPRSAANQLALDATRMLGFRLLDVLRVPQ